MMNMKERLMRSRLTLKLYVDIKKLCASWRKLSAILRILNSIIKKPNSILKELRLERSEKTYLRQSNSHNLNFGVYKMHDIEAALHLNG